MRGLGARNAAPRPFDAEELRATTVSHDHTVVLKPEADLGSVAFLYCRRGLRRGQLVKLVKQRSEFGRAADCDVPMEDNAASAHQGAILLEESVWKIFDFASTNGTLVNGHKLGRDGANPAPLADGDSIVVGETEYVFKQID